jgi:anti-anti-sigma factor
LTVESFRLAIEPRASETLVSLEGDVDHATAQTILEAIRERVRTSPVVLDLRATQYLDSAGIAMLDSLRQTNRLRIVVDTESIISRTLAITALDRLIPVSDTLEAE